MLVYTPTTTGSQLIRTPDVEQVYTRVQECGSRRALTRALAEYLKQLAFDAEIGGRRSRFENVFFDRAVWEEGKPKFPSALVKTDGQMNYNPSKFTPDVVAEVGTLPGKDNQALYLLQSAETEGNLQIEIWATDPEQRDLLVLMLEDGLFPLEWMAGFRLTLPHYFGANAEFLYTAITYSDTPEETTQRYCKAFITVQARMPVLRLAPLSKAQVRLINETREG